MPVTREAREREREREKESERGRETDGRRVEEGRTTTYEQRCSTGGYPPVAPLRGRIGHAFVGTGGQFNHDVIGGWA